MPIYEYKCAACEYQFEVLQKISDPLLNECPNCNKSALKKLVSAAGFRLSGSGWYETDFKSDNKRNLTTNDSHKKAEPKEGAKDSNKPDKKDSSKKDTPEKKSAGSANKETKVSKPAAKDK